MAVGAAVSIPGRAETVVPGVLGAGVSPARSPLICPNAACFSLFAGCDLACACASAGPKHSGRMTKVRRAKRETRSARPAATVDMEGTSWGAFGGMARETTNLGLFNPQRAQALTKLL